MAACAAKYRPPAGKWLTVDEWNYASGNQPDPEYPTWRVALDKASSTHRMLIGIDERAEPNGARFLGIEGETGSIEAGKSADFIVLNQDILNLADQGHADDIRKTGVSRPGSWAIRCT